MRTNTKTQGDIGLGKAIAWFMSEGYSVFVPLSENQSYDLVVEKEGKLQRVEVKTSGYIPAGKNYYEVKLATYYLLSSGTKKKHFNPDNSDLVFIHLLDGRSYLIPTDEVQAKSSLVISSVGTSKWDKFLIE